MSKYNSVVLTGEIITDIVKSYQVHDKNYYSAIIRCKRGSDKSDELEVVFNEQLLKDDLKKGAHVVIRGEFRSIDFTRNRSRHLGLYVYARSVEPSVHHDYNKLKIEGVLCKKPIIRVNPSGTGIAELMVAVNRTGNITDHIPCIVWGDNDKAETLNIGDHVKITGRIQSREHIKNTDKGSLTMLIYEVSVWEYEVLTSENGLSTGNRSDTDDQKIRTERQKESALRKHYQTRNEKERKRRETGLDESVIIPMD